MIDALKIAVPSSGTRVIVGVSGGADSVAMLHLLKMVGVDCVVAHCNFHLRGEESERDARFVRQLANEFSLPYFQIDFQTETYAEEKSISIEMAARELRYSWFDELLVREKANCIAIAHHADDVVETFLMNMSRGTGIHGLTGIKEWNGKIWRPLLSFSRNDIEEYLCENSLPHVEDSTNSDSAYTRNKFRNQIIPLLKELYPTFQSNVLDTISHLRETELFLNDCVEREKRDLICETSQDSFKISVSGLKRVGKHAKILLYEILSPYGFSASTIIDICEHLDEYQGARVFYSKNNYILNRERETLWVRSLSSGQNEELYEIKTIEDFNQLPIAITTQLLSRDEVHFEKSSAWCYLDEDKLTYPLQLRKWKEGDYFVPFGMKGKKKLSDYFTDSYFSYQQKKETWILTSGESIAWIVGYRSDDRFRVDAKTKNVLVLHLD